MRRPTLASGVLIVAWLAIAALAVRHVVRLATQPGPEAQPHAVSATVDGDTVRVTVSPDVEADALAILDQPLGLAVAKAVREARGA